MKLKLPPNYKSVLMAPDGKFLATKTPQAHYDNQGWDYGTSYCIYGNSEKINNDFKFYYGGEIIGGNAKEWEVLFNSLLKDINLFTSDAAAIVTLSERDVSFIKKLKKMSVDSFYLHGEDGEVWLLAGRDQLAANCGDRWRYEQQLRGKAIKPFTVRVLLKCLPAIWNDNFQVRINHSGLLEFNSAKYDQTLYIKAFSNIKAFSGMIKVKPTLANFRINSN